VKLFSDFLEKIFISLDFSLLIYYNINNMKKTVRQPQQERSIEKKNKIINAGYELFSEVGYYGTNTAEIAKRAGVSTGIVYGYFSDKRDILICVLEIYLNKVIEPLLKMFNKLQAPLNIEEVVPKVIDEVIKIHKRNNKIHEALHSLSGSDEAVNTKFIELEDQITLKISDILVKLGLNSENIHEKVHFSMGILQDFAHEYVYDKHDYIDYFVMREMVANTIVNIFN
jgi:AcrR family transcriptional regulator